MGRGLAVDIRLVDRCLTFALGQRLGRGGEGEVYALVGEPRLVAKIYTDGRQEEHDRKLSWMLANPPWDPPSPTTGWTKVSWPVDKVVNAVSKRSLGYVMPRVMDGKPLHEFISLSPKFPRRFRLRIAHNLAGCVAAVHALGSVVIGDLNDANALVNTETGEVTLIDMDSAQIDTSRERFRCNVGRPDVTAPEIQGQRYEEITRTKEHDQFALSVLIYALVCGHHPFTGRYRGAGRAPTLAEAIQRGLFPNGGVR
jgi:DNA-binding helix-hairpin-helix protein with protein kinase domain